MGRGQMLRPLRQRWRQLWPRLWQVRHGASSHSVVRDGCECKQLLAEWHAAGMLGKQSSCMRIVSCCLETLIRGHGK